MFAKIKNTFRHKKSKEYSSFVLLNDLVNKTAIEDTKRRPSSVQVCGEYINIIEK